MFNVSDPQWVGIGTSSNTDVIQFSQLMTNKMWQPTLPAYHANPFMVIVSLPNVLLLNIIHSGNNSREILSFKHTQIISGRFWREQHDKKFEQPFLMIE